MFALSYVIRPIGGIVFGWVGDRSGRRRSLLLTVVAIGLANTALGLPPTYATVGVLAPVLLVIVRIVQGFFAGGEVGGAATVIAESASPDTRARYGAFTPMGTNGGFCAPPCSPRSNRASPPAAATVKTCGPSTRSSPKPRPVSPTTS